MWLSLAFGHISEWSIQSHRDKLAVIKEEPTTQKTTFKLWFRNNMPLQASLQLQHKSKMKPVMWVLRKCLKYPVPWGPRPWGYGDTSMSSSQFGVNKTYLEILAFPKKILERGNSQDQNKAKSSWGFGTHFSYPLSEKVWLKTSDILPVGKDVYFWLYTLLKSLSWDIYPFKNYHRPLKFLWLPYTKHSL